MKQIKNTIPGILLTFLLAIIATIIANSLPIHLISASVFSLIIGMCLNPFLSKYPFFKEGIQFTSKKILRYAIILMGLTLSITQVVSTGKYSIIVMIFTLITAFGGGYIVGKLFNMNWKLSSLISAGTGICGGSAIAAIAPTIEASDEDVAYAISATFIFDVVMVILFPIMGAYFMMSDLGFGLWAGTAINDTSSVVAAGYAFSDTAGSFAVIVKLTRTLSIIPTVLIFSFIHAKLNTSNTTNKISIKNIFPFFILGFLLMVIINSTGLIPITFSNHVNTLSKFFMVMALGAIGMKTNFKSTYASGFKPMLHGFIISTLVVVVSFVVQVCIGQL